jgi:hypothetical protein
MSENSEFVPNKNIRNSPTVEKFETKVIGFLPPK